MKFLQQHPGIKHLLRLTASTWVVSVTIIAVLTGLGLVIGAIAIAVTLGDNGIQHIYGYAGSQNKLLSIKIAGVITGDDDDTAGLTPNDAIVSGYAVKQRLYDAAMDDSIKGVVLEINSAGGTIYGARAIADGVAYYRDQTNRPVIAYVQGMAASGAYWAAASADEIIADYGSDVGAIGVIMGPFKYYDKVLADETGVVTENGVQETMITAGKSKDLGNPYRQLTADEKAALQRGVDNDYSAFVDFVAQRRAIDKAVIKDKLGALPYDTKTALEYDLIDATGGRENAYERLAEKVKATNDYEVIRPVLLAEVQNNYYLASVFNRFAPAKPMAKGSSCAVSGQRLAYYGDAAAICRQ